LRSSLSLSLSRSRVPLGCPLTCRLIVLPTISITCLLAHALNDAFTHPLTHSLARSLSLNHSLSWYLTRLLILKLDSIRALCNPLPFCIFQVFVERKTQAYNDLIRLADTCGTREQLFQVPFSLKTRARALTLSHSYSRAVVSGAHLPQAQGHELTLSTILDHSHSRTVVSGALLPQDTNSRSQPLLITLTHVGTLTFLLFSHRATRKEPISHRTRRSLPTTAETAPPPPPPSSPPPPHHTHAPHSPLEPLSSGS
jgi:hypothetical protein